MSKNAFFNWNDVDGNLLNHYQKLGHIRKSNPAIGIGQQTTIDQHTCIRTLDGDTVLIRLVPVENQPIDVSGYLSEGKNLVELYTGQEAHVTDGCIQFPNYQNKIAVIKKK